MYGITIDIGTSKIVVRLIGCDGGSSLAERHIPNPQSFAGADIISRARYAAESQSHSDRLRLSTIKRIQSIIRDLLLETSLAEDDVAEIVLVGNTVMHHIVHGLDLESLLQRPYVPHSISPITVPANNIGLSSLGSTPCYSPPLLAAFVGADASANMAAAKVWEYNSPILIIDIGVNTELLLWDGENIWVASAASGPAFESMSFRCGMQAKTGAIDNVTINTKTNEIDYTVIGDTTPSGICGSGIISLLSEMLKADLIDERGSIVSKSEKHGIRISGAMRYYELPKKSQASRGSKIYITQAEIRDLQLAKSAVAAGIYSVLRESGIHASHIAKVCLTGSFGSSMDFKAATTIGMLPDFKDAEQETELEGASLGAAQLLCCNDIRDICEQLALNAQYVDLESSSHFTHAFPVTRLFESWSSLMGRLSNHTEI